MLTGSSDSLRWLITGAGDAERLLARSSNELASFVVGRRPPHISHICREGWLWNVHCGQISVSGSDEKLCRLGSALIELGVSGAGVSAGGCVEPPLMAALRINANEGLMPHVRHGGIGKDSEATEGSKLEGTGLVKVQIGQTQMAVLTIGVTRDTELVRKGLEDLDPGDEEDCWRRCTPGDRGAFCRTDPGAFLIGLGCIVTFAEDRRKPAYRPVSNHSDGRLRQPT